MIKQLLEYIFEPSQGGYSIKIIPFLLLIMALSVLLVALPLIWSLFLLFIEFITSFLIINFKLARMKIKYYKKKKWLSPLVDKFVGTEIVELACDSKKLLILTKYSFTKMVDYSYVVFPLAKAYEGYLKKLLINIQMVKEDEFQNNPDGAINKYFNPRSNEKIFKLLRDEKRDKDVPYLIYSTYQECRNLILHHDPYRDTRLRTIKEAEHYMHKIEESVNRSFAAFGIYNP